MKDKTEKMNRLLEQHVVTDVVQHSGPTLSTLTESTSTGFDESNDDYKVVVSLNKSTSWCVLEVYSLMTNSWRKVGLSTSDSYLEGSGTYASGKLHWYRHELGRGIFVSFDLENETFGTVEWPNGVERCFLGHATIDGCLCCISPSGDKRDDHADCWLLKEYGANDSWHKFATLERPLHKFGCREYYGYYVPSFVGADGDILCCDDEDDYYTVLFISKDGCLGSRVHSLYPHFPPVAYFESLVEL